MATDGAALYASERAATSHGSYSAEFGEAMPAKCSAGICRRPTMITCSSDHVRARAYFQLGYFTWVEQQGVPLADFESARSRRILARLAGVRYRVGPMIEEFNEETGAMR